MRQVVIALSVAALPIVSRPVAAQDISMRTAPQTVSYTYGVAGAKSTVSQFALPLFASVPINDKFSIDFGTAYAQSKFSAPAVASQTLSGLTDTQLRGSYSLNDGAVIITLGMNLPTGKATVPGGTANLAGLLGTDLLGFPVPIYGSGFAFTGGVAVARPMGDWNVGGGLSVRAASAFAPSADTSARFTPGTEFRGTLGADRALGAGRLALGATFSANGSQQYAAQPVTSGSRIVLQGGYLTPLGDGKRELFVSGWSMIIGAGNFNAKPIDGQNITSAQVALGFHVGSATIEPNIEGRFWNAGTAGSGTISFIGLRTRIPAGKVLIFPGASFGFGSLKSQVGATNIDAGFSGFRATLGAAYTP
jgi:hypothetical protein